MTAYHQFEKVFFHDDDDEEPLFQAMSLSHGETPRTETPHYTTTPADDEDENLNAATTLFSEDDRVIPHSTSQFLVSDKKSKILSSHQFEKVLLYHQFEKAFFLDDDDIFLGHGHDKFEELYDDMYLSHGHDKFEELLFHAMSLSHGETPRTETPHYTTAPAYDEEENMNAATTLFSEDFHVANSDNSTYGFRDEDAMSLNMLETPMSAAPTLISEDDHIIHVANSENSTAVGSHINNWHFASFALHILFLGLWIYYMASTIWGNGWGKAVILVAAVSSFGFYGLYLVLFNLEKVFNGWMIKRLSELISVSLHEVILQLAKDEVTLHLVLAFHSLSFLTFKKAFSKEDKLKVYKTFFLQFIRSCLRMFLEVKIISGVFFLLTALVSFALHISSRQLQEGTF